MQITHASAVLPAAAKVESVALAMCEMHPPGKVLFILLLVCDAVNNLL